MNLFAERNSRIDTENAFKVGPHIVRVEQQKCAVIKLNFGEPDFSVPRHIKAEIKRQLDLDNTKYCDPKGLLSLRQAISKQINETRGLKTNPEQWSFSLEVNRLLVWLSRSTVNRKMR
jgi:aspartate/methionine/tyrosine aminotransferase